MNKTKVISCIVAVCIIMSVIVGIDQKGSASSERSLGAYTEITVSAAGDCTLGTDANFSWSSSLPAKYNEVGDPSYFFKGVLPVFESDDLTIINMEGTLTDRGGRADKTYAFKGDPSYTQIITSGKIEACNIANNHSRDYGEVSYEDTQKYLREAGITVFGNEIVDFYDVNGVRVGLVGVYELPYGISCKDTMISRVQQAKEGGADLIIVSFHWGTERMYYPEQIQQDLAHAAIDNGADLVLGHHPHVLQGIEKYKGKYIAYSLGNFCFGGNKNPSDKDTMIYQQTFRFLDGKLLSDDAPQGIGRDILSDPYAGSDSVFSEMDNDGVSVIPCRLSSRTDLNDYQPTLLSDEDAQRVMGRLKEYSSILYRR